MRSVLSWLRDEDNRGIVSLVAGGIAIFGAATWTVYLYLYPPAMQTEVSMERTVLVCTGDNQGSR